MLIFLKRQIDYFYFKTRVLEAASLSLINEEKKSRYLTVQVSNILKILENHLTSIDLTVLDDVPVVSKCYQLSVSFNMFSLSAYQKSN
jgi:hypothetical protein